MSKFFFKGEVGGGGGLNVKPGNHYGICVALVDIGRQKTSYDGHEEWKPQVMLTFEFPNERMRDKHGKDMPLTKTTTFTYSLHPKSNLNKFISGWRGKPLTADELKNVGFDLTKLVGAHGLINVVEAKNTKYTNIAAAAPLPKNFLRVEPQNTPYVYEIGLECPPQMPEFIFKRIAEALENQPLEVQQAVAAAEAAAEDDREPLEHYHTETPPEIDDIPF